jgi:hypothetical protein
MRDGAAGFIRTPGTSGARPKSTDPVEVFKQDPILLSALFVCNIFVAGNSGWPEAVSWNQSILNAL